MTSSDPSPTADPSLDGLDPEKLLAAALRSSPVSLPAQDWEPPPVETVDAWFPEYRVDGLIGRGAMGAVYHAVHLRLEREVAIKILPAALAVQEEMAGRFERESRALARLSHPNIVGLHDFGRTESGHLFIVMEHVAGADLSRLIRGGDLSVAQALEIIGQVCDALQYAHGQGFVHRDIKPGNVLVDTAGRVRIADFGLTKLSGGGPESELRRTLTGASLGTPEYIAPEQLHGGEVDHRADIYSLGVMLYEMLTGDLPRGAWMPPSQRTSADARLDAVVTRAMQTEPDKRYQQASEVKSAVNAAGRPAERAPVGWRGMAAVLALILTAGGVYWLTRGYFIYQLRPMEKMAGPEVAGTSASAPDHSQEALLEQSKAKAARTLAGIRETVSAQEDKVADLQSQLAAMAQDYGIDPSAAGPPLTAVTETSAADRSATKRALQTLLETLQSQRESARQLSGEALYAAFAADDETLRAFSSQLTKDVVELQLMLQSGFGPRHPRLIGLQFQIQEERNILDRAVESRLTGLDLNITKVRTSLESMGPEVGAEDGAEVNPEKWNEYSKLKLRCEIAEETLTSLRKSAADLTMAALTVFQQEVDGIAGAQRPEALDAAPTPEPPAEAAPTAPRAMPVPAK